MRLLLFLCCVTAIPAAAEEYCSLVIEVTSPSGTPVSGLEVQVDEQSGSFARALTKAGEARFCDLGYGVASVTVARFSCGETSIRAQLAWRQTKTLKITWNGSAGCEDSPPFRSCILLLRFSDGGGNWIKGVSVTSVSRQWEASDAAGRTLVSAEFGTKVTFQAAVPGFEPEAIPLVCMATSPRTEKFIQLRRSKLDK